MHSAKWTRLEVGYEVCLPSRRTDQAKVELLLAKLAKQLPPALKKMREAFAAERRLVWLQGGSTDVDTIDSSNAWVRKVLQSELNQAIPKDWPKFALEESGLVKAETRVGDAPDDPNLANPDKPVGSRCVLIGDRWYNSRSYRIDSKVAKVQLPKHCLMMATLWWECEGTKTDLDALLADWIAMR